MASNTSHWIKISAFIAFALFVIVASFPFISHIQFRVLPLKTADAEFRSTKQNVWADLSKEEARDLTAYLFSKPELNLTEASKATLKDNSVVLLELLQPNKTDALTYLNGSSDAPARWARIVILQGGAENTQYVIYAAGPLPLSVKTELIPLTFCYNSGRNRIINPIPAYEALLGWGVGELMNVSDITQELLGSDVNPDDPDSLGIGARIVPLKDGTLLAWLEIYAHSYNPGSSSLLPQGLYVQIDISGPSQANWKLLKWSYNNIVYESVAQFRQAMRSPTFKKIELLNHDGNWTALQDFSEGLPDRKKTSPVMIQPEGARYKVDEQTKFVSWMGFEFFIATSSDTAVALRDIKFDKESVIFELALQEMFVTYAADSPKQGGQDFLDTTFMMGLRMVELVPGYDCPAYATYLSTHYHSADVTIEKKNSICIFEYTADYALQRHTSDEQVSIARNTYMVVRFVSTVGNYDYTFDYIFYLDGTIEVKIRASGYIFGLFWNEDTSPKNEYGYRIHDATATAIHDHILSFKADFDVVGTSNTMVRVGIEPVTKSYAWDDEESTPRNTMHLVPRTMEKEAGVNWAPNSAEMLLIYSENTTNTWGEKRGYRIQPGSGIGTPAHRTAVNSSSSGVAAEWATKDLWVLKRKDTEPKSSTIFNALSPADPLVDFRKFVDEEDIVDDDLVVFFNLGNHHVPHSGDIPNTLMHTSASSVMFTPFNFHDSDPTRLSAQGVRISNQGETRARYYGGRYLKGVTLKDTDLEPDQSRYNGPYVEGAQYGLGRGVGNIFALAFGLF